MHEWDPRKDNYEDLKFKSFNKEPAKHLSTTMFKGKGKPIKLFVTGIPQEISEMKLHALFESAGTVINVKKCFSKKPELGSTFGFITMATQNDAEKATRDFNGFRIGPHILRVCVAREDHGNIEKQDLSVKAVKSPEVSDTDTEEPKEKMKGIRNEKPIQNLPPRGRGEMIKKVVQAASPVGFNKPGMSAQTSPGNRPFKKSLLATPLNKLDDVKIPDDGYPSRKINYLDNSKYYQHFYNSHQSVGRGNQQFMQGVGRGYQPVLHGIRRGMNNMYPWYPGPDTARSMEWNNFSGLPIWNNSVFERGQRMNWGNQYHGPTSMFRGRTWNDYGPYQHQYGDSSHPMMERGASFYDPPFSSPCTVQTDGGQMSNNYLLKTATPRSIVQPSIEVEDQQPVKPKAAAAKKAEPSTAALECSVCQKLGFGRCSQCKLPYCGIKCQTEDWEHHKNFCKIQRNEELSQAFENQFDLTVGDELIPQVKTLLESTMCESIEITKKNTSQRHVPGNNKLDVGTEKTNEQANSNMGKNDKNDRQIKQKWQCNKENLSGSQKVVDQKEVNNNKGKGVSQERQKGGAVEDKVRQLNKEVDECKPVNASVSSDQPSLLCYTSHKDISAKESKTLIKQLPNMSIPALSMPENQEVEVIVGDAVDLNQFWVLTKEWIATNMALSKMKQKYQSRACDVSTVMEGDFYACNFTDDGGWYRAKVIKVDGKDLVVQYIDFGNKEKTNVSKLRQLDGDFVELPSQGIACTLYGVAPFVGNQWNIPVKKLQEFITNNAKYFATCKKILTGPTGQIHEVILRNLKGLDVAQQLVSLGLVRPLLGTKPSSQPGSYPAKPGSYPVDGANASPIMAKALKKATNNVPVGQEIQFMILDVQSPDNFTIQITQGKALKQFAQFHAQLNKEYKKSPITQYRPQCEGELVVSLFTGDNQKEWYRAEVTKITDTGAGVVYIDYLNSEMVVFSMLRKASPLCLSVPAQGISCTLSDINKPKDGKWPSEIRELYAKLETSQLKGLVKKCENGVLFLEFFTPDGKSVNEKIKSLLSKSLFKQPEKTPEQKLLKTDEPYKSPKVVSQTVISPKVVPPIGLSLKVELPELVSPKVEKHLIKVVEMSEIPLDGSSNVALFTSVTRGDCIYVQLCEEPLQARLVAIMQQLNECGLVGGFEPKLGDYVAAQFTDDDETLWYRARVEKILNGMYTVFFLDYGNSEIVSSKCLSKLDENLLDLPMMAVRCQLAACEEVESDWLLEQFQLLVNKMVKVKAVDYKNGIFKVTMYLEGTNINNLIKSTYKEHAEKPKSAELKPKINNGQVKTSVEQLNIAEIKLSLDGELLSANVVFIENPACFYVHICDKEMQENLQELLQNLNRLCAKDACPYSPKIGNYIAALYSDGKDEAIWYRAQVQDLNDSQVQVFIVDYGNVGWVKKNCVRKLDEKFAALPAVAIKCKLVGATGNESEDMKAEFMHVIQVVVKIKVVLKKGDAYVVDMFVSDRDNSLKSVAEFLGLHLSENQKPSSIRINCASVNSGVVESADNSVNFICKENNSLVTSKKSKKQNVNVSPGAGLQSPVINLSFLPIGTKVSVATFVVDSLCTFYVQKTDSETQTMLAELMLNLEEDCLKNHNSYEPIIGEFVAAYYDDGEYKRWYRGVVEDKLDHKFKVMFIDYGNTDVVGRDFIQKLNCIFYTLPRLAIRCSLLGATGMEGEHVLREFKASVMNMEVYVIAESFQNESYMVEMFLMDGRNINSELGPGQIDNATNIVVKSPKTIVSPEKVPTRLSSPRVERKKVFTHTLPKSWPEGINVDISVIITNVVKPNNFHCQIYHTDNKALQIILLCQNINEMTTGAPELMDIEKGELCCAKFPEDNCWYRATILDVFPDKTVQVEYVDYGNQTNIPVSLLCPITEELARIPLLAFSCMLHGVVPVGSSWTDEVTHALAAFQNRPLSAKVVRVCNDIYELDINDQVVSIANSLIAASLAKRPLTELEIKEVEEKRKKLEMLQKECALIQAQLGQMTKDN